MKIKNPPYIDNHQDMMSYLISTGITPRIEVGCKKWEGDGFFIRTTAASYGVFINKAVEDWYDQGETFHCLFGPCLVSKAGDTVSFAIDGRFMPKEEWEKDPQVVEYRLRKVIEEVLSE